MAIVKTSTGSQWHVWEGVAEDIVLSLATSGVGTVAIAGFTGPSSVGSYAVLLNGTGSLIG